jgi:paraquat-inducible protein B
MSEYEDPAKDRRDHSKEEAIVKSAKWSPWVWVVPALAIFFVGYLIVRYGFFGGGDITVKFTEARGLDRYSPVRFRGAKVGTVQKITVDEDLKSVEVSISMDASMNYALKKGTRFWIVEPGIESGGIGGLLSGTYVGISPGEGDETREFIGQEYPPILSAPEAGKTFILEGAGAGSLAVGSPVTYQGIRVGRILGSEYDINRRATSVHAFVVARFADRVRQSTRWWRGGGLSVSLSGGGVSMGGSGLSGLIAAPPVSFYTPEVMAGAPVAERTRFQLYDTENAAIAAADGPHLTYLTFFPGPLKGLTPGTPVQMKGVKVGRVRDVRLRYVAETASLETPVVIEIDPRELEFEVTDAMTRPELRVQFNDAMAKLVNKGMRATLAGSLVLPGASAVALEFVARPGTGRLVTTTDPPIIPAAGGSGIEGALGAIGDIADRIRALPIEEIAGNLRSASARVNSIVSDPALNESIARVNRSLAEVEKITSTLSRNVGPITDNVRQASESAVSAANSIEKLAATDVQPIVQSLRNAADSAAAAARRAEELMGTSQKQGYDLGELIRELTRAAEAVRALSQYLTEHPDSLLKGRPK